MVSVEGGCQEAIFKQGKWGDNVEVCQTAQELHWKSVATGLTERWIRILKFWFKSWSKRYKDECLQRSIIVWGCIPDSGVRDFVKIDGIIRTIRFWSTMKYHMAEFLFFSTTVIPNTLQENQNTIIKAQTSTLLKKIILTETRAKSSQDRSAEYSLFVKTTLFSKNMILFLRGHVHLKVLHPNTLLCLPLTGCRTRTKLLRCLISASLIFSSVTVWYTRVNMVKWADWSLQVHTCTTLLSVWCYSEQCHWRCNQTHVSLSEFVGVCVSDSCTCKFYL